MNIENRVIDGDGGVSKIDHEESHEQAQRSSSLSTKSSPDTPATAHSSAGHTSLDDIWLADDPTGLNSTGDDATSHEASITPDIKRLRTTHFTAGFREGLAAARAEAVQPGFDEGYLLGAAVGIRAGWLKGTMEGLGKAIDFSTAPAELETHFQQQAQLIKEELRMEELLGLTWIDEDGTWKWSVEEPEGDSEPTIQAVASSHPVIQKWHRVVSAYCRGLGVKRREAAET